MGLPLEGLGVMNERNTPLFIFFLFFYFLSRCLDTKYVLYHIVTAYPNSILTMYVHIFIRIYMYILCIPTYGEE